MDALAGEVSVAAVRGLPQSYVEAVSSAGGIWSTLGRLVHGRRESPVKTLRRVDDIATAIDRRFVVWIEDLERFAGSTSGDGTETLEDAERLNPIRALLFALDSLGSVTVITATTSLQVRFDLEKTARFVEVLPRPPESRSRECLVLFVGVAGPSGASLIPLWPPLERRIGGCRVGGNRRDRHRRSSGDYQGARVERGAGPEPLRSGARVHVSALGSEAGSTGGQASATGASQRSPFPRRALGTTGHATFSG